MTDDEKFMARAVGIARVAAGRPGASPIACVIVLDGEVLAEGHNEVGIRTDPTAHAEIVTIRTAARRAGPTQSYVVFHAPALRHVHYGIDLGEGRPHRLRSGARSDTFHVFRGQAFRDDGFHPRRLP